MTDGRKVVPIARVAAPLREQVIGMMRTAILDFQFRPGQRLIERELIERFQVSRTTIREALQDLASEGLVTVIPQRGAIVATLTAEEAEDLYDVRAYLESLAVQHFIERASEEQVAQLREAVEELSQDARENPGDAQRMLQAKDDFYAALIDGAGSEVLRQLLNSLQARARAFRAASLGVSGRPAESARELRAVMDAIERSDTPVATALCAQHIRNAATAALSSLAAEEEAG